MGICYAYLIHFYVIIFGRWHMHGISMNWSFQENEKSHCEHNFLVKVTVTSCHREEKKRKLWAEIIMFSNVSAAM